MSDALFATLRRGWTRLRHGLHITEDPLSGVKRLLGSLSPRERQFVMAAGVVVLGVCLSLVVIDPLWSMHSRLRSRLVAKERELRDIITLATAYDKLRRTLESARPSSQANLSPFAFLEGLATSTLGRDKLAAISPVGREERSGVTQESIELKLSSVSLQELVELLYKIDTAGTALRCSQISIKKRYKDPYTFDVTLTTIALDAR
ncbi:MAG: type II secretion system protein GspM [Candidatus Binatia bacterium]